jgi:hypothetical protein
MKIRYHTVHGRYPYLPNVKACLAGGDKDFGPDVLGKVRGVVVVHAPPLVLQLLRQIL